MRAAHAGGPHLGAGEHAVVVYVRLLEQLLSVVQHVRLLHSGGIPKREDRAAAAVDRQVLVHVDGLPVLLHH